MESWIKLKGLNAVENNLDKEASEHDEKTGCTDFVSVSDEKCRFFPL